MVSRGKLLNTLVDAVHEGKNSARDLYKATEVNISSADDLNETTVHMTFDGFQTDDDGDAFHKAMERARTVADELRDNGFTDVSFGAHEWGEDERSDSWVRGTLKVT